VEFPAEMWNLLHSLDAAVAEVLEIEVGNLAGIQNHKASRMVVDPVVFTCDEYDIGRIKLCYRHLGPS